MKAGKRVKLQFSYHRNLEYKASHQNLTSLFIITHEVMKVLLTSSCILMDFPIHIDTISMGLPIVHLKGSEVEFSQL